MTTDAIQSADGGAAGVRWRPLFRAAAAAAALTVAFIPIQIGVFIHWPPPGYQPTLAVVTGYFNLLRDHRVVGLLDLDLLLVVDNVLAIPIVLALYLTLRRKGESSMLAATALGLAAIAGYLASNASISMLSLGNQYWAANTDAQRAVFLSAGLAALAASTGTSFHVSYILGSAGLAITALVMLRSAMFTRLTAWAGLLGSVIGLGLYVPTIGIFISVSSVPFLALWNVLIARGFIRLAASPSNARAETS